jgi:hypothetical protein
MLGSAIAGKPHHHSTTACRSARRIEHDAPAGQLLGDRASHDITQGRCQLVACITHQVVGGSCKQGRERLAHAVLDHQVDLALDQGQHLFGQLCFAGQLRRGGCVHRCRLGNCRLVGRPLRQARRPGVALPVDHLGQRRHALRRFFGSHATTSFMPPPRASESSIPAPHSASNAAAPPAGRPPRPTRSRSRARNSRSPREPRAPD